MERTDGGMKERITLFSRRLLIFVSYRTSHRQESDQYAGVMYNNFADHRHFYEAMSSVLESPYETTDNVKIGHFSIPHLILQSLDDPISTWRTDASNDPNSLLYPQNLVDSHDNLVVLLTEKGGHVGWPVGLNPHSWIYMNDWVAANFVLAYEKSRHRQEKE
jgi:predicted alpha/beta-fold hydrolase